MDSPRKFNDCYFYYYSTCTKGDNCVFRHEPSALGCETMCSAWQQGKCTDTRCKLRHMELRKNRKQIPCYWETQPGGCRKKHCPFMHKNPEARTDGIAPSQPAPIVSAQESSGGAEPIVDGGMMRPNVLAPSAGPPSVPVAVLLQQQRQQVVLDSAILGVLPGTGELLPRRVVHTHAHAHAHAHTHAHAHAHDPSAYALPVDPLVVNFEEESDNESAPSWTPTKKVNQDDSTRIGRTQSQELERLEEIQAESAAYYSYAPLPPVEVHKLRKIVRKNLNVKYDKLSLDEISGKKPATEKKSSLDFKVLSLDEIRARKKVSEATIIKTPITLNLNRKRKLSTHETITTSGNKILKVVRSNSVVYKKLDNNAQAQSSQAKAEQKRSPETNNRKRTLSELCDLYELGDELVDNCYEFKKIKIAEQIPKPRLVRNRSATKSISESKDDYETGKSNNESDNEVQFVGEELGSSDVSVLNDEDIIDVDSTKMGDPVDIVDLCDQDDNASDPDLDKSVPDIVASCQKNVNKSDNADKTLLNEIDALLDEEL